MTQSRTPDSNRAFMTPEKATMARKPPPEPATAITGTWTKHTHTFTPDLKCRFTLTQHHFPPAPACAYLLVSNEHAARNSGVVLCSLRTFFFEVISLLCSFLNKVKTNTEIQFCENSTACLEETRRNPN